MADLPVWPLLYLRSLLHVLVLIAAVYVVLPLWLWPGMRSRGVSGFLARALATGFGLTLLIHLLAALGIFEGLAVALVMAAVISVPFVRRLRSRKDDAEYATAWLDLVDEAIGRWARLRAGLAAGFRWERLKTLLAPAGLLTALLMIAPAAVAAWERFSQALVRVSPPFSDAEVTIKWYRLLQVSFSQVSLYVDGIYPRGLYTFLSLLGKFTDLNAILLVQTVGPLQGLGLVLLGGIALYVATKQPVAAVVYMWLYGTMAAWFPISLERHAGLNSQEFGMLFILPAAAFAIGYVLEGERTFLVGAAAALGLAVLTHPVSAIYAAIGVAVPAVVLTLAGEGLQAAPGARPWRRLGALAGWSVAAGVAGALPPLIGLLAGLPWHGSSLLYADTPLAPGSAPPAPPLLVAIAALAVVAGLVGLAVPYFRRQTAAAYAAAASFGLGAAALTAIWVTWGLVRFLPYRFLLDRGPDPAAMLVTAAAGAAAALLLLPLTAHKGWRYAAGALLLAAMALSWRVSPPQAAAPYRVFNDQMLYQYLRVDAAHQPGTWAMVAGPDGYTLSIGRAFHIYPQELDTRYRIDADGLTDLKNPGPPVKEDIYFFIDRKPPENLPLMLQRLTDRQIATEEAGAWISLAKGRGLPLRLVYHDATLDVWELHFAPGPKGMTGTSRR